MISFEKKYQDYLKIVEDTLDHLSSSEYLDDSFKVTESIRYSLLAGGKRIRPILSFAVAESLHAPIKKELYQLAACLEMIHNYSLIHDDLPAMDNDDFRRGKPANHVLYGEGMAVLAGDGLLNLAFENLLEICSKNTKLIKAAKRIAKESGVHGMVGGQSMDLTDVHSAEALDYLVQLQNLKTGALIRAAVLSGYYYAEAYSNDCYFNSELEKLYEKYANKLGLAFQIRDDLLDVLSTEESLGKTIGKDERDKKLTFVTLLGIEKSKEYEKKLIKEIYNILDQLKRKKLNTEFLNDLTSFLVHRDY
ncbi:MAG TPA: farnesyl diphosphate synthase [Candidatus Eisenbacteria bacterium]|nr:farnesyl diphosphate synthase [Candidatus Eisenbacteria bacterium]